MIPENIFLITILLFTWHAFIMIYVNRILTEEFINTNSDMCICGINLYRNIYYICSNNPLKNYINYHFFPKILIEQHTIPREYDPYSLIVSPVIKWGKFQCMRTHI